MRRTDEGLEKDPTKMMKTNNKCVLLLFLCNFFDFFVARTGPGGARPWQRGHGFVCFIFCLFVLYLHSNMGLFVQTYSHNLTHRPFKIFFNILNIHTT